MLIEYLEKTQKNILIYNKIFFIGDDPFGHPFFVIQKYVSRAVVKSLLTVLTLKKKYVNLTVSVVVIQLIQKEGVKCFN